MTWDSNANLGNFEEERDDYNDSTQFPAESYTGPFIGPATLYHGDSQSFDVTEPPTPNLQTPASTYTSPTWTANSHWDLSSDQQSEFGGVGYIDADTSYLGAGYSNSDVQYSRNYITPTYTPNYFQDPLPNDSLHYGGFAANTVQSAPDLTTYLNTPGTEGPPATAALPEPSIGNQPLQCKHCPKSHSDAKSRDRHEMEVHAKPKDGETQPGWYMCKCGKNFCYFRKSNYNRHLKTCREDKRAMLTYHCQCGTEDADEREHKAHYTGCREGRNRVGRPHIAG